MTEAKRVPVKNSDLDRVHRLAVEFNPEIHDIDDTLSEINQIILHAVAAAPVVGEPVAEWQYGPTAPSYAVGSVVSWRGFYYRCKEPVKAGGGTNSPGHSAFWEKIGTVSATTIDGVAKALKAEQAISGTDVAFIRHSEGGVVLAKKVVDLKAAVQALAQIKGGA
ncbi:hypothetical protein [Brevundimonas sp.]|uniref:hypothetical protein n=1 Tax=Brevundimonas sp. TaxID=1871086 RepID=UPI00289D9DE7|nr:hypothetical protein [Brevundimonas sp.]